jgi:periplasmic divalent cation tolerance protein
MNQKANKVLLALSTFPDQETARRIAREVVEAKLAACANILPAIESIYHWQGKIESSDEVLVFFKLPGAGYDAFQSKLKSLHPYEVPEIVAFDVTNGFPDYLRWVAASCA